MYLIIATHGYFIDVFHFNYYMVNVTVRIVTRYHVTI